MKRFLVAVLVFSSISALMAAEPKPLGEAGKELFKDTFSKKELGSSWKTGPGTYTVSNGLLTVKEKPSDMHVAAFRAMVPLQNAIVECEFKLDGAKVFHVGFDPAPGELPNRQGHLVNVILSKSGMTLQKPGDKVNKDLKPKTLAKNDAKIDEGQWHTLRVALVGTKIQAIVDGKHVVEGDDPELKVKKPAVVFRVGGESVSLKSVTVSALK